MKVFKKVFGFILSLFTVAIVLASPIIVQASSLLDNHSFTPEEMAAAFRYQTQQGNRINNPSSSSYKASVNGLTIQVPKSFVSGIIGHVEKMQLAEAVRYVFEPDAGHGHLILPKNILRQYDLENRKDCEAILKHPELAVLYHTAKHLDIDNAKDSSVSRWKANSNVVGKFNATNSIEILATGGIVSPLPPPEGYEIFATFYFSAHKDGNFQYNHLDERGEKFEAWVSLGLDITLDVNGPDEENVPEPTPGHNI
jgi:hypothetical protein